jgi:alkylation response protein AidB-like acyl-CoA dehydrogenase
MTEGGAPRLSLSPEQEDLRRSVRELLDDVSPEAEVRRVMATDEGFDQTTWRRLADLGLLAIALPEEYGGAGYGPAEAGVFLSEAGRSLLPSPYFASILLGATAVLESGDRGACRALLPSIADGSKIATLAVTEVNGSWDPEDTTVRATRVSDRWILEGTKTFVPDGLVADVLIVLARTPSGLGLFSVEAGAQGLQRSPLDTVDQTRKQAKVVLETTPARLVGSESGAGNVVDRLLDTAAAGLAAEQAAGARRILEIAVDYAKVRHQFGRPIGSFQAVKHLCADMLVHVEHATAAAAAALAAAAERSPDLPVIAAVAKVCCSEAYLSVSSSAIEVLGGIGFTWEHPAQLYYKRALADHALLGSPAWYRERIATRRGFS